MGIVDVKCIYNTHWLSRTHFVRFFLILLIPYPGILMNFSTEFLKSVISIWHICNLSGETIRLANKCTFSANSKSQSSWLLYKQTIYKYELHKIIQILYWTKSPERLFWYSIRTNAVVFYIKTQSCLSVHDVNYFKAKFTKLMFHIFI